MAGIGLNISIGWDELPADNDSCTRCGQMIFGTKYCWYTQVMDPQNANYAAVLCEECHYHFVERDKEG